MYYPTLRADWVTAQVDPWLLYLKHPSLEVPLSFKSWLISKALAGDVPTLSLTLQLTSQLVMPAGSKGATRDPVKSVLLTLTHVCISVARLLLAFRQSSWPSWFKNAWKHFPPGYPQARISGDAEWLRGFLRGFNNQRWAVHQFIAFLGIRAFMLAKPT